jgi:hypothetical protein
MDEREKPRPAAWDTTSPIEVPSEKAAYTLATAVTPTAPLSVAGRLTEREETVAGELLTVATTEPRTVDWKVPVMVTSPGLTPWTVEPLTEAAAGLLDTNTVCAVRV